MIPSFLLSTHSAPKEVANCLCTVLGSSLSTVTTWAFIGVFLVPQHGHHPASILVSLKGWQPYELAAWQPRRYPDTACRVDTEALCSCKLCTSSLHTQLAGKHRSMQQGLVHQGGISDSLSITEESWISRMADASTMFLTMKRLIALSLATSTPDASQRTLFTCRQARVSVKIPISLSSDNVAGYLLWSTLELKKASYPTSRPFEQRVMTRLRASSHW